MRIKRFLAPDMRRAIQLVRQEHGADAVILSSRAVEGGIEIVSALDYDQGLFAELAGQAAGERSESASKPSPTVEAGPVPQPQPAVPVAASPPAAALAEASGVSSEDARPNEPGRDARTGLASIDALQAMQRELALVKDMLREQFAQLAWADMKTFQPERAVLTRRVESLGLEPDLVGALVDEAAAETDQGKAWRTVLLGLARRIRIVAEDPIDQGGVIALVGPTGVGKTTTIAKLAARHCLRHGPDSIALVSTDTFRVGAQRQLDAYGVILGVPVRRADSPAALKTLLHEQRHRRLILVDTAGLAPRDCRLADAVSSLHENPDIRVFVVLAANMQAAVMREAVRSFGGSRLAGAVLTKLDESNGIGAALSVLIERDLPVVWVSEGQRVPEDLKLARQATLVASAASGLHEERKSPPLRPFAPQAVQHAQEAQHAGA